MFSLASCSYQRLVSSPGIAQLEKRIPEVMAELHVPGVSVAIIKDARIAWRENGSDFEPYPVVRHRAHEWRVAVPVKGVEQLR